MRIIIIRRHQLANTGRQGSLSCGPPRTNTCRQLRVQGRGARARQRSAPGHAPAAPAWISRAVRHPAWLLQPAHRPPTQAARSSAGAGSGQRRSSSRQREAAQGSRARARTRGHRKHRKFNQARLMPQLRRCRRGSRSAAGALCAAIARLPPLQKRAAGAKLRGPDVERG